MTRDSLDGNIFAEYISDTDERREIKNGKDDFRICKQSP